MSISEKLPGMRPGSTVRNLGVGIAYFFLVMMVLGALVGDDADDEGGEATSDATADEEEEAAAAETEDEDDENADDSEEAEADDDGAETGDENGDDPPEAVDESGEDESLEAEDESEDVEEEAEVVEDEAEEEGQITADDAEALLAANGLDVTAHETDEGVVMEYRDVVADETELAENLGAIAGAHAAWYDDDPSIGPLTIEMYNSQTGEYAGTTSVDESTVQAYNNDEITAEEYAYELLTGLESSE
jgi:hypothetical protein